MSSYLTAIEGMTKAIDVDEKLLKTFTRRYYDGSFEQVYRNMLPVMEAIETLYNTVGEPDTMLDNMASALVDHALEQYNGIKRNNQKQIMMMNLNMQLVVFVFPILLEYKGNSSKPLTELIRNKWSEAFPKSNIQIADRKLIQAGFHRKFCYITTAVCSASGKADDCYELKLLRDYRDGYLAEQPGGNELIHMYYDIAPTIVKHIDETGNSAKIYQDIMEEYITPCISMIEQKQNEACKDLYEQMVLNLKDRYFM